MGRCMRMLSRVGSRPTSSEWLIAKVEIGIIAAAPDAMSCKDACGRSATIRANLRRDFFFDDRDVLPLIRSSTASSCTGGAPACEGNSVSARRAMAEDGKAREGDYQHIFFYCCDIWAVGTSVFVP